MMKYQSSLYQTIISFLLVIIGIIVRIVDIVLLEVELVSL